jgi:hypothetical protein
MPHRRRCEIIRIVGSSKDIPLPARGTWGRGFSRLGVLVKVEKHTQLPFPCNVKVKAS